MQKVESHFVQQARGLKGILRNIELLECRRYEPTAEKQYGPDVRPPAQAISCSSFTDVLTNQQVLRKLTAGDGTARRNGELWQVNLLRTHGMQRICRVLRRL